jgi:hypothetical protein
MNRKIPLYIALLLLILGTAFGYTISIAKRNNHQTKTLSTNKNLIVGTIYRKKYQDPSVYINTKHGYSFPLPEWYEAFESENTDHLEFLGVDESIHQGSFSITIRDTSSNTSLNSYVEKYYPKWFASGSTTVTIEHTSILESENLTINGIETKKLYLNEMRHYSNGTKESVEFGPIYVYDLAKQSEGSSFLLLYPNMRGGYEPQTELERLGDIAKSIKPL